MDIESQTASNRIFQFKKLKIWNNKIINIKTNSIHIDERNNTIQCKDSENEPTITKAENPLNLENCVAYFEVQVLGVTEQDTLNIGLMSKDNNTRQFIGKSNNSFGYYKGELYLNKKKVNTNALSDKLKIRDRIGVGIDCKRRTFFVVKNELIVFNQIDIPPGWNEFYPGVGLSNENEKVKIYFSPQEFNFKIEQKCEQIQKEIQKDIFSQDIPNHQIYSLVHEYLAFNGFDQTLDLLNSKQLQFVKLKKLVKNPSITNPLIDLEKKDDRQLIGQDEEMNQPLRSRNRIMSERIQEDEQCFLEVKRKNTEMIIEQLHQSQRKLSVVSNLSLISNVPDIYESDCNQFYQEEMQQQMTQTVNENQRFLLHERLQILELISHKRIQEAIELLQEFIPKIFLEDHIMAFLKGHIFLRKIKEQSNLEAINFSRKEKESFSNHFSTMFPFFNSTKNNIQFKIFKNIFCALSYNQGKGTSKSQDCLDMMSDRQFQFFSNYINKIILKHMGYLGCSRLTFYINNLKRIQEKIKDLKGMGCGIDLKV